MNQDREISESYSQRASLHGRQGPKARALPKLIADGLISLGGPAEGFETCLVSTGGTVLHALSSRAPQARWGAGGIRDYRNHARRSGRARLAR